MRNSQRAQFRFTNLPQNLPKRRDGDAVAELTELSDVLLRMASDIKRGSETGGTWRSAGRLVIRVSRDLVRQNLSRYDIMSDLHIQILE